MIAYVYLDSVSPPSEIMLTWITDGTEHRAYWGWDLIAWGVPGNARRRAAYPGPISRVH